MGGLNCSRKRRVTKSLVNSWKATCVAFKGLKCNIGEWKWQDKFGLTDRLGVFEAINIRVWLFYGIRDNGKQLIVSGVTAHYWHSLQVLSVILNRPFQLSMFLTGRYLEGDYGLLAATRGFRQLPLMMTSDLNVARYIRRERIAKTLQKCKTSRILFKSETYLTCIFVEEILLGLRGIIQRWYQGLTDSYFPVNGVISSTTLKS